MHKRICSNAAITHGHKRGNSSARLQLPSRKDKNKNIRGRARGKMDNSWVSSMEDECERIVRPQKRGNSLARRRVLTGAESRRGKIWVCCVSCASVVVLEEQERPENKPKEDWEQSNGFALTVCGSCEGKNGRMVGRGEETAIRICEGMIAGSLVWQRISQHCVSNGWQKLELRSDRVVGRRALLGREINGMSMASIRIKGEGGEQAVEVLSYVEAAFI